MANRSGGQYRSNPLNKKTNHLWLRRLRFSSAASKSPWRESATIATFINLKKSLSNSKSRVAEHRHPQNLIGKSTNTTSSHKSATYLSGTRPRRVCVLFCFIERQEVVTRTPSTNSKLRRCIYEYQKNKKQNDHGDQWRSENGSI